MTCYLTDWFNEDITPLPNRKGEYETLEAGVHLRRWWDGVRWSLPYPSGGERPLHPDVPPTSTGDRVVWRGLSHRFVRLEPVRYGKVRCTVVDMRRVDDGWEYALSSFRWVSTLWVDEASLKRDKLPKSARQPVR